MNRVAVLGDVMVDVVAQAAAPLNHASDTPAEIRMLGGGGAANTAAWLARTRRVALLARVGDDGAGHAQVAALRRAGVEPLVAGDRVRPTGTCVVLVEPGGERTMLPDRGANVALAPADLPAGAVEDAEHLHLSGYALLDPGPRPAALEALARARAAGVPVSVDPASAAPLAAMGADAFLALTSGAALLLPNEDEARVLTGLDDPAAAARALAARTGAEVVVKCGRAGAVWSAGADELVHVPAAGAVARDTTGAGDAFAAGLLAARLDGAAPAEALAAGGAVAAEAIARPGARPEPPPLLHVAPRTDWMSAQTAGLYAIPAGAPFVHLCLPRQLPGVLSRFFAGVEDLLLLEVDEHGLDVRFETAPDGEGDFPHLYGALPLHAIRQVTPVVR